jgi:hypothetical protein
MPTEKVERLPKKGLCLLDIQQRCTRFVGDNSIAISDSSPLEVKGLHDRASDNWDPLLTLAELAGGEWPEKARKAALMLAVLSMAN